MPDSVRRGGAEAVSSGLVCNPATCARRAWQTLGVRILVNFMHRDGWSVHCLAADARTLISGWVMVRTNETLLRLLKASGATTAQMDEIADDMRRMGRGSTFIEVNDVGYKLLRIRPASEIAR